MKFKLVLLIISLAFLNINSFSQNYSRLFQQGKDYFGKGDYMNALERFDFASEFAKTTTEKKEASDWKSKSREKIVEMLKRFEQMQLKLETAIFERAVKDQNPSWKGFENYPLESEWKLVLENTFVLDLSGNALLRIPREIEYCKKLQILRLSNNEDMNWEDCFIKLKSCEEITELHLTNNQISELPAGIGNLHKLYKLYLNYNKLNKLPAEFSKLSNLTRIVLENNEFTKIPAEILNIQSIQELSLNNNKITELPPEINKLKSLNRLYLSSNNISKINPGLFDINFLKELELGMNKINLVPPDIWRLSKLVYLSFCNNQLKSLPVEIWQLPELKELNLSGNKLNEISKEIGESKQLESLNLSDNLLKSLPLEIENLKKLTLLNLEKNEFSDSEKEKIQSLLPYCKISF